MTPYSQFNAAIIQKYDRPALRDTVFPSPALYRDGFGAQQYVEQVELSNGDPIPRHLSVAVNLPAAAYLTRHTEGLDMLKREVALKAQLFDPDRRVMQLGIQGDMPVAGERTLLSLIDLLEDQFPIDASAVRSVALDGGSVSPALVITLAGLGFSRLRMNISSFSTVDELGAVCEVARAHGFMMTECVYSLLGDTGEPPALTVEAVLAAEPDVVSLQPVFSRDISPRTTAAMAGQLAETAEQLVAAGYTCVGHRQFARHGALRNLDTCAFCSMERVGIGPGALSRSGDSYCQNERRLLHYCSRIRSGNLPVRCGVVLSGDNLVRRSVLEAMMCSGALDVRAIEQRHNVVFSKMFARELVELERMAEDGLVTLSSDHLQLEPVGRLMFAAIAHTFDGHLRSNVAWLPIASRAVQRSQTP